MGDVKIQIIKRNPKLQIVKMMFLLLLKFD